MNLLTVVKEIFMENEGLDSPSFLPKSLTKHYTEELSECFLDEVYIATEYRHIEKILTLYKYHSHREYEVIFQDLYKQLIDYIIKETGEKWSFVPVPMHWSRYIFRWFDHIWRIVKRCAKHSKQEFFPILSSWWSIFFRHQSQLSREKRLENKKNTIRINGPIDSYGTVFLFDDVISTWATANECACILKSSGAQRVIGVFLASNIS